jgi:hypothetical protein
MAVLSRPGDPTGRAALIRSGPYSDENRLLIGGALSGDCENTRPL